MGLPSHYLGLPERELLWAVGAHDGARRSAQICTSVFNLSIVPDRSRVAMALWKSNLTHDLVRASGTAALTLLTATQLHLLDPLGLRSGRDGDKLAGLALRTSELGDPCFPDGVGAIACRIFDTMDLGDSTLFAATVAAEQPLAEGAPLTWADAQKRIGGDFVQRYRAKVARDIDGARRVMRI